MDECKSTEEVSECIDDLRVNSIHKPPPLRLRKGKPVGGVSVIELVNVSSPEIFNSGYTRFQKTITSLDDMIAIIKHGNVPNSIEC